MVRRYLIVWGGIALLVLVAFGFVEALDVPLLVDPSDRLERGGVAAAVLGVGLLLADVVIPVPSSLIMTTQGAIFGIVGGTLLGMIGGVGATLVGFAMGRRGSGLIQRFVGANEGAQSDRLLRRHGTLAILATRPLPVLAEATAIVAGSTAMTWRQVTIGAVVGCLPAAALYSIAGASATSLASGMMVFVLVIGLAGVFWGVGWLIERRMERNTTTADPAATSPK
jgi:uncharacterized membrane protein YdjX (TVP38/TMEM64 family)